MLLKQDPPGSCFFMWKKVSDRYGVVIWMCIGVIMQKNSKISGNGKKILLIAQKSDGKTGGKPPEWWKKSLQKKRIL